jgi:GAF domain-containing protein
LDLDRLRRREKRLRMERDSLLDGLRILTGSDSTREVLVRLLKVLNNLIAFDHAFILREDQQTAWSLVAATDPLFEDIQWIAGPATEGVLAGRSAIIFDTGRTAEWCDQPDKIRSQAASALHACIETRDARAMIVCVSRKQADFNERQAHLIQRFTPLASQALQRLENREKLHGAIERAQSMGGQLHLASESGCR